MGRARLKLRKISMSQEITTMSERRLKTQATTLVMELGQLRLNADCSAGGPLFPGRWVAAALSIAGAIFLILEMDLPSERMIRISS
jgi:hypothetical protein